MKNAFEKMEESAKTKSSSDFDDVFDMDVPAPLSKESKKKPKSGPKVSEIETMLAATNERFDRSKPKVDRIKAHLSLLE